MQRSDDEDNNNESWVVVCYVFVVCEKASAGRPQRLKRIELESGARTPLEGGLRSYTQG
jgi:hypothetical protein